jgi:hypothetical protein
MVAARNGQSQLTGPVLGVGMFGREAVARIIETLGIRIQARTYEPKPKWILANNSLDLSPHALEAAPTMLGSFAAKT